MAAIKEVILKALEDLLEVEFKEFKWWLINSGEQESLPRGKLENAVPHVVVDYLVQHYCASDAGKVAVRTLRKMKQNELADQLKKKLQEVSEAVPVESAVSSSAATQSAQTPAVSMNITATGGGNVKAPVLHGGVYNGPLTFK
ncbi:uncharacterized protein si:ch211-114l13.9 [Xyrauchen texanus]|uniref:uncharacterized protein si:ch211-114l13.9 n=1 Tax=Xyrauchen texanus TaxID=154827 RepID=UPI0022421CE2|nr:uncharacterized protein si:ch211-114l13.9 [Xyrauchen texanus]